MLVSLRTKAILVAWQPNKLDECQKLYKKAITSINISKNGDISLTFSKTGWQDDGPHRSNCPIIRSNRVKGSEIFFTIIISFLKYSLTVFRKCFERA